MKSVETKREKIRAFMRFSGPHMIETKKEKRRLEKNT